MSPHHQSPIVLISKWSLIIQCFTLKKYPGFKEALEVLQNGSLEDQSQFKYRIKYLADDDDQAAVAADINVAVETISFNDEGGLICNNGEDTCSSYEISFRCGMLIY